MTDIEKIEARIQQMLREVSIEGCDPAFVDLIAEVVKEYGELRDEAGWARGWDAGHDSMGAWG